MYLLTAKLLQSCPTLCDPVDGSPARSPVPGILQARTLEWVAISFSKIMYLSWFNSSAQSHFADKGLYSQSYGFSSRRIRMWELDHKED